MPSSSSLLLARPGHLWRGLSCVGMKTVRTFIATATPPTSPVVAELKDQIMALSKQKLPEFLDLRKTHGKKPVGEVTVEMVLGGMRGIKGLVTETSDLDAVTGIQYRGMGLHEVNKVLPKAPGGECGLPEAALWLLLTGNVPTQQQTEQLNAELHRRSALPQDVIALLDNLPHASMHPMTQLAMGVLALQPQSQFAQAYRAGNMKKRTYWDYTLEDSLTLLAQIPLVAARIFRNTYGQKQHIATDPSLDWAGNYAKMLGVNDSEGFKEVTRLYLMLHADHEGGNVSAHTTHVVGSALSDPYYAWSAGISGLAGPLHGLANQECLKWLEKAYSDLKGAEPTIENVTQYAKDTLAAGQVIPGYGHAVLRQADPRFMLEKEFAQKHMADDPLVRLVGVCYEAIPPVLQATGKVKNPYPNVDAHSGVCMKYYGLSQADYYTVVFAVSRAIGVCSQLVWSRVFGMPIERPKSVTLDWLRKAAEK